MLNPTTQQHLKISSLSHSFLDLQECVPAHQTVFRHVVLSVAEKKGMKELSRHRTGAKGLTLAVGLAPKEEYKFEASPGLC